MRFVLTPESGDPIVLKADAEPVRIGWYIGEEGIEGWFGAPDPREDPVRRYGSDGDGWPTTITYGSRTLSFDVIARFESTLACALARDRVNSLAGQRVEICGYDAAGPRSLMGYLSDDPEFELTTDEQGMLFTLTFVCPYPIKKGEEHEYLVETDYVTVCNAGNAPAWPRLVIDGPVESASLTYDDHTVSWSGEAYGLTLDLFDDLSDIDGITEDDAFSIMPGYHTINVATEGECTAYIVMADAWR